jgi:hypothetical protein
LKIGDTRGQNEKLTSLQGLENLSTIGGDLVIFGNDELVDISHLFNLTSIGGALYVDWNITLPNLYGLENIEPNSIESIVIKKNSVLSVCEVQSICDYLSAPSGSILIENNAPGCNSPEEVIEACEALSIEKDTFNIRNSKFKIHIYPNPTTGIFTIEGSANLAKVSVFNTFGMKIFQIEQALPAQVDLTEQPKGIYLIRIETDTKSCFEKVVVK